MAQNELADFFTWKAGVAMNTGEWFGPEGTGFMRMNLACPRKKNLGPRSGPDRRSICKIKPTPFLGVGTCKIDSRFSILASKPAACRLEICLTERNVAMREIKGEAITQAVARLCMSANRNLPQDVRTCITQSQSGSLGNRLAVFCPRL